MFFTQFSLLLGVGSWCSSCLFPGFWHLKNEMNMHTDHRLEKILIKSKSTACCKRTEDHMSEILQSPD